MTAAPGATNTVARRRAAPIGVLVGLVSVLLAAGTANAQSLTVLPVSIELAPGQMATTLTVINQGDAETAFQIRAFAWSQRADGDDQLGVTDDLRASPPIATVA